MVAAGGIDHWLSTNWFQALQSAGIIVTLAITGWALHSATKTNRVSNLLLITQQHRDIWKLLFDKPQLEDAILADRLDTKPITPEESLFVTLLILHISACFEANKAGALTPLEGLKADVGNLLSAPVPRKVWSDLRGLQNADFVKWIEDALRQHENLTVPRSTPAG